MSTEWRDEFHDKCKEREDECLTFLLMFNDTDHEFKFQVLDERVYHIEYAPEQPEPYYKATGKELQPRPVGEEHGIIVYNYMPISAVHYVSTLFVDIISCFIINCQAIMCEVQCQGRETKACQQKSALAIFFRSTPRSSS